MHLAREAGLDFGEQRWRGRAAEAGEDIGPPADHVFRRLVRSAADLDDDLIGIPVGLRGLRPLAKVLVADQPDAVLSAVGSNHVRPRCREWAGAKVAGRRPRGQHVRERQRKLVQELRVCGDEMERHGPSSVVRDDSP
jgi:hypothetical protein